MEEQDAPQENSMDLFTRMMEKQLQEEEERMRKAGIPIPSTTTTITTTDSKKTVLQRKKPILSKKSKETLPIGSTKPDSAKESATQEDPNSDVIMVDATTNIPHNSSTRTTDSIVSAPQNEDMSLNAPQESSMELFEKLLQQQLKQEENDLNEESSFDKMPVKDRLKHKNWKARLSAFETIYKQFQESIYEHEDDLVILIQEKNASALDKGLDALLQYMKSGSKLKNLHEFGTFLIDKCITSAKTTTKQKGHEILLQYIESNNNSIFIDQIVSRLKNEKNAKTKAACIEIFREAAVQYGAKEVSFKEVFSCINTLLDDTDKKVRTETQSLIVEMYKWVKDSIRPKLESIRPAQLKDLEVEFEKWKSCPIPEPQRKKNVQTSTVSTNSSSTVNKKAQSFDPMDIYEAEAVFNKIPSNFFEQIADAKWQNRRDALVELNTLVNKPKIQNGNYTELVSKLGKIIEMDTNVSVIKLALDAITHIATGLRTDFIHGSKILYPTLFAKLKDKNKGMCESISSVIFTLHRFCLSIFDVIDDSETSAFTASINSKIASQKLLTMKVIEKCITTEQLAIVNKSSLYKRGIKIVMKHMTSLCEDASAEVRSRCFKLLRDLSVPESGVEKEAQNLLAKYDKTKEVTAIPTSTPTADVKPVNNALTTRAPTPNKKQGNTKTTTTSASSTTEDIEKGGISNDDALNICNELFSTLLDGKFSEQIGSKIWKERLEAFEVLEQHLQENGASQIKTNSSYPEAIIRYIVQSTNSLKESNVQILSKALSVINWVCRNESPISKFLIVHLLSNGILEKIATPKVKEITRDCLTSFSRSAGIQFVFAQLYKVLEAQKNPKIVSDCIEWMEYAVRAFGIRSLKVDQMIEFIKKVGLENSNPTIKKQTTKLLCTLKLYLGDGLLDFFKDVKSTLLASIKKEFEQMSETEVPVPTEQSSTVVGNNTTSQDSMLPRVDISQALPKHIKDLENSAWKIRLDALCAIEKSILDANKRIVNNNGIMDLINSLRKRLEQETNMKIVTTILSLLQLFATAIGVNNGLDKYVKIIFPTILSKQMNDNKKNVRQLSIEVMEFWSNDLQVTASPFLKQINKFLSNADAKKSNPDGKRELLSFVLKHFGQCSACVEDIHALIKPVLDALLEPKVESRKVAEGLIVEIVKIVGEDAIQKLVRDVKPTSSRDSINSLLAKYFSVDTMDLDNTAPTTMAIIDTPTMVQPQQQFIQQITLIQQPQQQSIGIFNSSISKEMRIKKKMKWYFENQVRPEQFEWLKDAFRQSLHSMDLFEMFFSSNPKKVYDAIVYLIEQFNVREFISQLDILLQYSSIRLADQTNTANLNKILEFLNKLFIALHEENYMLSDYESSSFVPIFVERMGHNMTSLRESMKKIFKLIKFTCQAKKLFHYLYDSLRLSKNTRTRCDCLVELVEIMEQSSISFLLGNNNNTTLQSFIIQLAKFVGDVDLVRVPALQCISLVHQEFSNEVKVCLEQSVEIPTTTKTLIFDKMKKMKQTEEDSTTTATRITMPTTVATTTTTSVSSISSTTSISNLLGNIDQYRVDEELAVVSLKKLVDIVKNESRLVVPNLKEIITCITSNIQNSFISAAQHNNTRICKYLLNTMMQLFGQRSVVEFVSKESLQILVDQLLTRLLDENLTKLEEGQMFLKALNTLMLKILENSNRTQTYTSLITLLAESFGEERKKYTELVVKCLLKLTKALSSTVERIDVDILLMDLHEFLTNNPPTQFKGKDDLPLRTIKTILNELVKVKGTSIRTHLNLIPTHKNPLIVSYIDLMLNNSKVSIAEMASVETAKQTVNRPSTPTLSVATTVSSVSLSTSSTIETTSEDAELTDIFNRISNKETTQEGLQLLFKFQKQHSEVDVTPFLNKCSQPFQAFIKRQLMKIEQQSNGGAKSSPRSSVTLMNSIPSTAPVLEHTFTEPKISTVDAIRNKLKLKNMQTVEQSVDSSIEPLKKRLNSTLTDLDLSKFSSSSSRKSPTDDKENSAPTTTVVSDNLRSLKERLERIKSKSTNQLV